MNYDKQDLVSQVTLLQDENMRKQAQLGEKDEELRKMMEERAQMWMQFTIEQERKQEENARSKPAFLEEQLHRLQRENEELRNAMKFKFS